MEYLILGAVLASCIAIMGELRSIKRLLELLVAPPISGPTLRAVDAATGAQAEGEPDNRRATDA